MAEFAIVSQSPKKRKATESDLTKKAKKKQKHTGQELPEQQSVQLPSTTVKSKKQRKEKKRKHEEIQIEEDAHDRAVEDVIIADAPEEQRLGQQTTVHSLPQVIIGDAIRDLIEETDESIMASKEPSCFYTKRISLYVPVPAVSLSTSIPSLLSLHLTPLLLTYYPPIGGILLAFSDPALSAKSQNGVNLPLKPPAFGSTSSSLPDDAFAQCADQFGVCWLWLSATFLVFAPQQGDSFKAWANVQSESFIGLISYNYFQTSVMKKRIPSRWKFKGANREQKSLPKGRKGKLMSRGQEALADVPDAMDSSQDLVDNDAIDILDGTFLDEQGQSISQNQTILVNGVDMTPGADRSKYGLQIDGSLLSREEEKAIVDEERRLYEASRKRKTRSREPSAGAADGNSTAGSLQ